MPCRQFADFSASVLSQILKKDEGKGRIKQWKSGVEERAITVMWQWDL